MLCMGGLTAWLRDAMGPLMGGPEFWIGRDTMGPLMGGPVFWIGPRIEGRVGRTGSAGWGGGRMSLLNTAGLPLALPGLGGRGGGGPSSAIWRQY